MKADILRADLIDKIEHADDVQLQEISGLLINYFNGQDNLSGGDSLSDYHKERLNQSIKEADAGLGIQAKEATQKMRIKYGLNG